MIRTLRKAAASFARRAGRWTSEANRWRKAARIRPERPGRILKEVEALITAGRLEEAERFCREHPSLQGVARAATRDGLLVQVHLTQGRYADASKAAEASHAAAPEPRLALKFARNFFTAKRYESVGVWLDRIPAHSREAPKAAMLRARLHYNQQSWDAAEALLLELASRGDADQLDLARLLLARIAAKKGDSALADTRFALLMEASPPHAEAVAHFVLAAIGERDAATALRLLDEHGDRLSTDKRVQLTARAASISDPQAAGAVYSKAVEQFPENRQLRLAQAEFLMESGDIEGAGEAIRTCLEDDPGSMQALRLWQRFLDATGAENDVQLAHARRMLEVEPANAALLNNVGSLLVRCGRRSEAIAHYQAAVELAPTAVQLWRNGAHHLAMAERQDEAAAFARRGVQLLGIETAGDLSNAAGIMQAALLREEALGFIEKALEIDPDSIMAHEMAVELRMSCGDHAGAWSSICKLDELCFPRRSEKIAHAAAQCIAGFRAVAAAAPGSAKTPAISLGALEPVSVVFPDALLEAIVAVSRPDRDPARSGVVLYTSKLGAGGAERQVSYVAQGLAENPVPGHPASFVVDALGPEPGSDFFLPAVLGTGLDFTELEAERKAGSIRRVLAARPDLAPAVRSLSALAPELRRVAIPFFAYLIERRPRAVHLWQDGICVAGGIAAAAAGVPTIVLCTRSTRPVDMKRWRRWLRPGFRALARYRGKVTMVNNSIYGARDYEEWLGWEEGAVVVVQNGYDFEGMHARASPGDRERIRAGFAIPADAPLVGGVMRFSPEKRPDLWVAALIRAVGGNDALHGLIVGDGPMRAELMALVASSGLSGRIHFAGRQDPVEPWMRAMDLLFLSSVTEGLPNVLIEAQALGVPVATLNVGGASETLIPGVTGIVLEEVDPGELARQLLELVRDPARLAAMGGAAVDAATQRFSLATMIANMRRVYDLG